MRERDNPEKPSWTTEMRERLGALVGIRPEWFDERLYGTVSSAEKRMINKMHYKGRAAFSMVLPSRETGSKDYTREPKE